MPAPLLLLVDDAPEVTFLVRRLARQAGQDLIAYRDASQALDSLATVQPDLAIVDVNLPGMSGLELCLRLRRLPGREKTPIALFSHPRQTDDVVAGLEAGADFVLSKDLLTQPDAWLARVQEILQACRDRGKTELQEHSRGVLSTPLPGGGIPAFNETLGHAALLQLGHSVVRFHLRRVVQRVAEALGRQEGKTAATGVTYATSWMLPDGTGLRSSAFPVKDRATWVAATAAALAEEIATVWGNKTGQAARTALAAVAAQAAKDGSDGPYDQGLLIPR